MNHSRQRDLILDYLQSTKSHPTAEEVYKEVQKKEPDISLGTVYRNLKLLSDNQMILKLHMENGIDHFDADTSQHFHFYCKKCEKVYDIEVESKPEMQDILKSIKNAADFNIEGYSLFYNGKCKNCSKMSKQ